MDIDRAKSFSKFMEEIPTHLKEEADIKNLMQHKEEYKRFLLSLEKEECYICNKNLKTISRDSPCLHWLLKQCKMKKKDFSSIVDKYNFFQINSYLRWVANSESFQKNINDMKFEQTDNKVIQHTIKWKNIEWSFECSHNDLKGHGGHIDYPHYHFQMTVNAFVFINYNGFHNKFEEQDLAYIYAMLDGKELSFGPFGSGMQDALKATPEEILENSSVIQEGEVNEGAFSFQTIIQNQNGIDGDLIADAIEESRRTKKSLSLILKEYLDNETSIKTIISPSDNIPEIAKRTEHKRR